MAGATAGAGAPQFWWFVRRLLWLFLTLFWVVGSHGKDLGPSLRLKVGLHQPRGVQERCASLELAFYVVEASSEPYHPCSAAVLPALRCSTSFEALQPSDFPT